MGRRVPLSLVFLQINTYESMCWCLYFAFLTVMEFGFWGMGLFNGENSGNGRGDFSNVVWWGSGRDCGSFKTSRVLGAYLFVY